MGVFYPVAMFLYEKAFLWKLPIVRNPQVERDLRALHPGVEGQQLCREYYVKKISLFLLLCMVGILLGLALTYSAQSTSQLKEEALQNNGPIFAVGAVVVAVLLFVMADKDLHDELLARREIMRRQYPDVIQKLLLYLGAGMTVRVAFQKLAAECEEDTPAPKTRKPCYTQAIYQEISCMCRELQTGVSEAVAYENFGRRTGVQEYLRLSTLLAQNLKKGNVALLQRLREESDRANIDRLQNSRKLGEEASTKLLVPMVLLLLVVMLMIMIPAFSSVGA